MIESFIIHVPAEDRLVEVVGEALTLYVPAEWRLIEVLGDDTPCQ